MIMNKCSKTRQNTRNWTKSKREEKAMNISAFRQKLDECGYPNAVSEPDSAQEFTVAAFGTLLYCENGPELEIRLPDSATKSNRVLSLSVAQVEEWTDEHALLFLEKIEE
jgi:hypothetical protein